MDIQITTEGRWGFAELSYDKTCDNPYRVSFQGHTKTFWCVSDRLRCIADMMDAVGEYKDPRELLK